MEPPIPDPSSGPPPRVTQQIEARPPALKVFMLIAVAFTVLGFFVYCDGSLTEVSVAADFIAYGILSVIWLVILWFLWQGRNWARIAIIVLCVLGAVGAIIPGEDTALQRYVTVADGLFSLVWAWWLISPEAVAFFKGKTA
jgi:hypothetical protein